MRNAPHTIGKPAFTALTRAVLGSKKNKTKLFRYADAVKRLRIPTAVGRQPTAVGRQPTAVGRQPTAVGRQPTAVGRQPTAVGRQPTAVGRQPTAVGRQRTAVQARGKMLSRAVLKGSWIESRRPLPIRTPADDPPPLHHPPPSATGRSLPPTQRDDPPPLPLPVPCTAPRTACTTSGVAHPLPGMHWNGGGGGSPPPLPPGRPAHAQPLSPLTPNASFTGICNRQ